MDKQYAKLGAKIKKRRTAQKITLKMLSNQTHLSISYLSQVERGQTSIAIASLTKIAEALGEDVSFFLETPLKYVDLITRSYDQEISYEENSRCFYNKLGHKMQDKRLEPMIINILPSKQEDIDMVDGQGEEFIYVLEGTVTIVLGGEKYALTAGDSVHFKSHIPHKFGNDTSKLVKLMSVSDHVKEEGNSH